MGSFLLKKLSKPQLKLNLVVEVEVQVGFYIYYTNKILIFFTCRSPWEVQSVSKKAVLTNYGVIFAVKMIKITFEVELGG